MPHDPRSDEGEGALVCEGSLDFPHEISILREERFDLGIGQGSGCVCICVCCGCLYSRE